MFAPRSSSLQPISEQATWQPPGTGFGAPALGQDHAGGQTHGAGWSMDPPPPSFQTHRFGTAANRRSTPFAGLSSSMNMMGSQLLAGGRRMMGEGVGGYPDRMVGQGFVQTPDTNQASGNTRIPWLVKQQDPASLQVEGPRPPPAPDEAPKGIQAGMPFLWVTPSFVTAYRTWTLTGVGETADGVLALPGSVRQGDWNARTDVLALRHCVRAGPSDSCSPDLPFRHARRFLDGSRRCLVACPAGSARSVAFIGWYCAKKGMDITLTSLWGLASGLLFIYDFFGALTGAVVNTFKLDFVRVAVLLALPLTDFLAASFGWELFKEHERNGGLLKPIFAGGQAVPAKRMDEEQGITKPKLDIWKGTEGTAPYPPHAPYGYPGTGNFAGQEMQNAADGFVKPTARHESNVCSLVAAVSLWKHLASVRASRAANLLRRNQFLETLRRKRAAALASQREDSTAPQAVEIRTLTTLVAQERSWLRPLLLAVTSGAQRLALRLQKMLWRSLAVLTDPEALLEPMFLEAQEMMGQGFPSSSADVQSWVVQEDGLFRAAFGAHVTEPWNRERLYLQLERSVLAKPGPTLDERAQELRSDEDREMLGSGLCAPRLAPLEEVYWLNMLGLRFRSQVKSKRRHLVASHLYELRLDVSRISLFQTPLASRDLASRASSLDALDSRETRVAGELQELFHRYQKEMESHVVAQLDSRLDMLVERGKALRTALFEAEALPSDAQATQAAQAVLAAREAYRSNLQERRKVRARRDEKETLFEQVCKNLYGKWRELRQVRQDFGFVSTPWRLTAQPQELHSRLLDRERSEHDLSADTERRARNVDAEIEESSYLQGFAAEQERDRVQNKWDMAKRGPGQPSYRFELSPTVELTSAEALRSRAYDGIVGDADASSAAEELERRQLASRVRVCVECRVSDRVVGRSPAMSISWDTGSTSSAAALLEEVPGTLPGAPDSIRPVHSFNLAVHVMPQNISFLVYVSAGGWWPRWHAAREVQLDIPSPEGRRVTHAAVLEQHLLFGPGMDDLGEEDGLLSQTFKGEVAVCVSWPGGGRGDYVVPPPAPLNAEGQPVANLKCLPCFRSRSPASQKEEAKPEEELDKMRIDSEAPEVGTTSTDFRGKGPEGTRLEDAHLCRRRLGSEDTQAGQLRGLRVEKLLQRVERAGMDSERLLVPGFESEVREEKEAKQKQEASDTKAGKQKESVYQMDFRKRIEERTRKMAMVKTHMSYKSIVREYGEEAEEGNLLELLERFQKMFQPKHTLRPSGGRRRFESSVKSIRVHISLAKVYDAPLRWQQEAVAQQSAPPPPLGGVPGLQTFGAPVAGPGRGFQWPRQMGSPFAGSSEGVFGATPAGIQTQQLPEIVIEMTLQDFHGNLLFKRTERAQQSTDPDINQILELPLHAAGITGMEELTQENLIKYSGELTINVFDELSQRLPGSGQEVRVRTQLRHLGKFVLPWDTLYAAKCSVKGHFPVDQHVVLFGYRPKSEKQRPLAPVHAEGAPPPPPSSQAAKMMCLGLEVTVDPPLEHPTRVQPQITLGKEPNMMLKHVQKWHDLLKSRRDSRILALGTDVDGRSCLICRFIRPQKPPDILPENPFAIEMAARYVSMIPSLQDNEMWNVEDLWCTDQEFLDIQCGDWEEHCILLCNFFNYIDRYRRECVGGYSTSDIQSYCVICDLMPEGEAVVVLRMDRQSGNCEFWHALKGRCYFLPAAAAKQRVQAAFHEALMQTWAWRPPASAAASPCRLRSIQSREGFNWRPNVLSLSKARRGRLGDGRLLSRKSAAQGTVTEASKLGPLTLWTLLAISSLNLMSFTAMFPITPILMERYSMKSEIGVGLVASILSDFIGRRKVLFMALLGGVVGSALQGVAIACCWPFAAFLVVRGVSGMFSGIVPVVKAYIVDAFDADEVPKVLAYREAAGTMAFIIGPALGGALASRRTVLALKVLPEPTQRRSGKGPKKSTTSKAARSPVLAVTLLFCSTCFHAYFPLLLARRYALALTNMGAVLTGISLTIAAVQIAGFERCRQRHGLQITMVLGALLVLAGLGALFSLPVGTSLAGVFTCGAVYGAGLQGRCALVSPALPSLLVQTAPQGRCGALLGIDSAIVNFGRIVAPSVFGLLYRSDQEFTRTVLASKIVAVASTVGFLAFLLEQLTLYWSGWSLCPRGTDGTEDDAAQPDTQQASVLKAMTSIPIRKVHLVFNADNVWANLQSEWAKSAHKGVAALSWDLDDARRWKPLFARGREDLRRLSGLPPDPTGEDDLVRDFSKEWRLEDPSQALTFQPKDEPQAARLENIFQLQLEQDIIDHRAGLKGTIVKDSRSTKFNHVIADRLGQLLEGLETLANSARRSGYESSFPLKSHATPPVTLEAIEAQMHEIENDFRRMGRPGRSVFGLPFNEPYKDYSLIWDAIYQSRILELGGDQADYALKVRIFPYAAGVLSIWVFIAAAMDIFRVQLRARRVPVAMSRPLRLILPTLLAVALYLGVARPFVCFVAPHAGNSRGIRGSEPAVSRAAVQLDVPMKESDLIQPDEEPERATYMYGFVPFAEQVNGRIAMIFFFVLIFQEFFTAKGLFQQIGEILGMKVTATVFANVSMLVWLKGSTLTFVPTAAAPEAMPTSRKTALKSAQYEKNIGKGGPSNSGKKKEESPFTVGPVVLAVFLFVVVGSAIIQIIASAQKGLI
eukprot:s662_g24.t1